jgi:hypothetical protein
VSKSKEAQLIQSILQNSALDIYKTILQTHSSKDIFKLAQQTYDPRLAFRASWTLEHILLEQKDLLISHQTDVITLYASSNNHSSLRSISKLVIHLLQQRDQKITGQYRDDILEKTFQLAEKNDCPVALLVNCWDILFLLSAAEPWLRQELKTHITFYLERHATPATKSRGLRILKKLKD